MALTLGFSCAAFAQTIPEDIQLSLICMQRYDCTEYKKAANICATSGNYSQCMTVKQNGSDQSEQCTYSGEIKKEKLMPGISERIQQSPDYECWTRYAEIKAAKYGYEPIFLHRMIEWVKINVEKYQRRN